MLGLPLNIRQIIIIDFRAQPKKATNLLRPLVEYIKLMSIHISSYRNSYSPSGFLILNFERRGLMNFIIIPPFHLAEKVEPRHLLKSGYYLVFRNVTDFNNIGTERVAKGGAEFH